MTYGPCELLCSEVGKLTVTENPVLLNTKSTKSLLELKLEARAFPKMSGIFQNEANYIN